MLRKTNSQRSRFSALLILLTGIAMALSTTGFSSSIAQTVDRRVISSNDIHHVVITGEDIRNLPPGESRIVQKLGGGNATDATPSGQVKFFIDGVSRNTSVPLRKTGAGHLILPTSNSYGVTKVGPGTLKNPSSNSRDLVKELTGTLILATTADVVYELRNMQNTDLDRIVLTDGSTSVAARVRNLKKLAGSGPTSAPSRVLIGSAKGIAQLEGWKPNLAGSRMSIIKFVCETSGSCYCSSTSDCFSLSAICSSEMTCLTTNSGTTCSCTK